MNPADFELDPNTGLHLPSPSRRRFFFLGLAAGVTAFMPKEPPSPSAALRNFDWLEKDPLPLPKVFNYVQIIRTPWTYVSPEREVPIKLW